MPNISPETVVISDHPVCIPKADVWSLGILLCELYTGTSFWADVSLSVILHRSSPSLNGAPPRLIPIFSQMRLDATLWDHPDASKLGIKPQALLLLNFLVLIL